MPPDYSLTRRPFEPGIVFPDDRAAPGLWFVVRKYQLLVTPDEQQVGPPMWSDPLDVGLQVSERHYLGMLAGVPCFATEVREDCEAPEGMRFQGLQSLFGLMDEDYFWIGGRAIQIVDWFRTNRFCGRCGAATTPRTNERSRECPACGLTFYPRLSPAVIVAVTFQNKLLLARSFRHPPGRYSVLAGFVEPGETLEECVVREVKEEVGLQVTNLRYFGSQPWPFPNSLMIGFTCESAGGEIVLADHELEEAGWFAADALPNVPPRLTISRRLIDDFIAHSRVQPDQDLS